MKRAILILVIILLTINLFPQKWEKLLYGQPNVNESSNRIIEHYDKGYIITASYSAGSSDNHGWIVKTDVNGNLLWDKIIGSNPDEVLVTKTVYDDEGNLYIFGLLLGDLEIIYPLIFKLDACGELEWCKILAFSEYEYGSFYDGILLENGNLLGLACMPDEEQYDMILLFCFTPDGQCLWEKSYASRENHPLFDTRLGTRIQFFDDIYIISGYVYSPHPSIPNIVSIRPMFIGIDTLFNEQWVVEFGLADNMKGKALTSIPINDSLFMGVGRYRYIGSSGDTQDAWAMYYNDQGEQIGYAVIDSDILGSEITESSFYEVERINDSLFFATAGYFYGEEDDNAKGEIIFDTAGYVYNYALREGTAGGNTSLVKSFDNKFTIACSYKYPNMSYDIYLYKLNQNLEQDTIYPGNYNYDSLCDSTIESGVIDVAGCDIITGIGEIPTLEQYMQKMQGIPLHASPNPSNTGEVLLEMENTASFTNMELRVMDVYGHQIHTESILPQQGAVRLDVSGWQAGMYVASVLSNGEVKGRAKFMVR